MVKNLHNLHIYPGALKSEEDGELLYRCLRSHQPILPQAADLGEIPLIIRHQHKLPVCTGEAGAYLRSGAAIPKIRTNFGFLRDVYL